MRTTVILLSGKQGSGKTSLAEELVGQLNKHIGLYAHQVKFAGILYEMHDEVLKVLHKYMKPRPIKFDKVLLQILGTSWGRETIDQQIWVTLLKHKMLVIKENYEIKNHIVDSPFKELYFVIDDVRFVNEFDAFPDENFPNVIKVRLQASEEVRKARCSMWRENSEHISETALDDYTNRVKFDIMLHTDTVSVENCVDILKSTLDMQEVKNENIKK
jgi:hypothetical protein